MTATSGTAAASTLSVPARVMPLATERSDSTEATARAAVGGEDVVRGVEGELVPGQAPEDECRREAQEREDRHAPRGQRDRAPEEERKVGLKRVVARRETSNALQARQARREHTQQDQLG